LKQLNAGEGEKIPTLLEVIDLIDSRCPLNIEIKGRDSSKEVALILQKEINEKGKKSNDFLVSFFELIELNRFKQFCPQIRISPIISCHPITMA
jgi:glycerophosphoryl diester phosphodiesterase